MCTDAKRVINKKQKRNKTLAKASYSSTRTAATTATTTTKTKTTSSAFYSSSSSSTVSTGHKSGLKWKIIISSILLLLCRISHVLAIRKGRLMSPSSFTALSGDLHVQIQLSAEDVDFDTKITTPTTTTTTRTTTTTTTTGGTAGKKAKSASTPINITSNIENTITTTLVISKYVDDLLLSSTTSSQQSTTVSNEVLLAAGNSSSNFNYSSLPADASHEQILQRRRKEIVQNIPLYPDPRHNVTQIAVPCQTFMQGGLYEMQVVTNLKTSTAQISTGVNSGPTPTLTTTTLMPVIDERLRQTLDVRWPAAEMRISPVRLKTYPEQPVEVELRFPEVDCDKAWLSHNLPEFWLELIYCGKERTCAQQSPLNISKSAILYAEQIRGYPKKKSLKLGCELFGLAGNYAVQLRPMLTSARHVPVTRRFLSVDWSDKFVFNVYARSIFPCDPHTGIGVLYEYPACILEQGDRVRVYAKLRADVASLKPPTTLHYVAEQRVVKNQYSLYFSCDLFSEKFVEYCFVYVSQAISGAVADVRMDCVPTLPVRDSDTGSWGPWSEWTPCSTNCLGGTRNRYRFCDSPPPRYGAKFCEGASVETQKCGQSIGDTWDCIYESSGTQATKVNRTEVSQEIGPGCRCGCIVHLGSSKPKRIIAGATQSCPGRSFWLLQVDGEETIGLALNFLRLPCVTQYIKVRDGPSLSSTLLIELKGGNNLILPAALESTGAQLLVEFYAGDVGTTNTNNNHGAQTDAQLLTNTSAAGVASMSCTGGFLANVEQIGLKNASSMTEVATTRIASVKSRVVVPKVQRLRSGFTLVHLSAVVFASIIILISALLGAQYVLRYRKYHLAIARRRDEGSRLHTPRTSLSSLHLPPSRAVSTTTLISEVIYLVKMRPKHKLRHSILRESIDAEALARETEFDGCETLAQMTKCDEVSSSSGSIATLCNAQTATMKRNDEYVPKKLELGSHSGTLTRKNSGKDSDSIISSGMSSICNSPPLLQAKRASRYSERYDAATLKMRADYGGQDCESPRSSCMRDYERLSQLGRVGRSASVSLTNGCYSPAASIVSTATIRTTSASTSTNPKESKEKQNRKKLLARPGSEFSLGNQEELELDYYDYNVDNAGATPGSYLGMDPAYLIWIPPFDDVGEDIDAGDVDDNKKSPEAVSEHEPLYEEIKMPRYGHYLSPGSNTETTSSPSASTYDELSPLSSQQQSKASSPSDTHNLKNCLIQKAITNSSNNHNSSMMSRPATPRLTRKQRRAAKKHCQSTMSLRTEDAEETFALHELSGTKSARSIAAERTATTPSPEADEEQSDSYVEKETAVVKSPSDMQDFLALDDIQFADESENSDHDAARELELKLRERTQVTSKQLRAKRVEASSISGMREVTV